MHSQSFRRGLSSRKPQTQKKDFLGFCDWTLFPTRKHPDCDLFEEAELCSRLFVIFEHLTQQKCSVPY